MISLSSIVTTIVVLAAIGIVVLLKPTQRLRPGDASMAHRYRARPLLSEWERRVLGELRVQLPPHLQLCPQVRLGDAFAALGSGQHQLNGLRRIAQKSVDFLLVDLTTGAVRLGIELNDKRLSQKSR